MPQLPPVGPAAAVLEGGGPGPEVQQRHDDGHLGEDGEAAGQDNLDSFICASVSIRHGTMAGHFHEVFVIFASLTEETRSVPHPVT